MMKYSQDELLQICDRMQDVSNTFYSGAVHTQCHTFIEFCGLMNEFIKVCRGAARKGIDFTDASTHTGQPLPLQTHESDYLSEKLNCILGPALASMDTKQRNRFVKRLIEG